MNFYFAFVIVVAQVFILSHKAEGQQDGAPAAAATTDDQIDQQLYNEWKKQVCDRVPAFTGNDNTPGPAWTDKMGDEEILELSFINLAYGLNSDSVSHLKPELGWKKTVIDTISLITRASCKDDVISEPFLNAAKNLYLYYLAKRPTTASGNQTDAETRENEWSTIISSLQSCANSITEIDISTQCGVASTLEGKDGDTKEIAKFNEYFDNELEKAGVGNDDLGLDVIIDTVWWMFSTTYARCYAYFYPNEDVILLFFQLFREDFLEQFLNRWRIAGKNAVNFPIIFGPTDFKTSADNVRLCAIASFQYENLEIRQLVRPVSVWFNSQFVRNFKEQKNSR